MLARTLRRALLETRTPLSISQQLPITRIAALSTVSQSSTPPPPIPSPSSASNASAISIDAPALNAQPSVPQQLSPSVRELLPLLRSQGPHYITVHIHGNPYLVTQGDSIRLPFYMHDVEPGDVLRLDRAINLGSRDFTLKAPAPPAKRKSATTTSSNIVDPTNTSPEEPHDSLQFSKTPSNVPHYIPHLAKERYSYIDPRLFVCRAVVTGVESEPMRIKEKTKRRQRHIRKVKSKHRYTIIKIKELHIRSVEDVEGPQA
ncbi:related to ribosomal protein YmL49, mitochondrial [Ramularia collo-cygni]|uniref:Large ribosomal subunit protein bL21m n=1 Tax=Ramularia collo-cygni TaxID=112498 RepID=A0A2D3V0D8_9PEZI|nr:related to ribosomal protein YmL49, mitochondrial [Ramularia collo-cygni]CZT22836.1 related to ribosomal protein YmL49, mitochondrial [Ramularia collo-cygni]